MNISTYKEIESFLFSQLPMFQRVGPKAFKKDLSNIKQLSTHLGYPHKAFKSIHVAGTNGKGSTSFFIATALSQLGYKVGLYTSPHYKDYRERIKVDGEMISKSYVKKFVNQLITDRLLEGKMKPSFFEISVAMAFCYFKEEQVDYAIVEVGLGGRLDSTNIITPELSVITNIGLDHTHFLGTTIKAIAKEKAGIIKKNVPVVIGRQQPDTKEVFKTIAHKRNATIKYATSSKKLDEVSDIKKHFASYQSENLQTAYTALRYIQPKLDSKVLDVAWTKRLTKWGFVGRYQWLSKKPRILADSAHNEMGIRQLFKEMANESYDQLHIVLAVVADKDLGLVLDFFPNSAIYYFSQAKVLRAMDKEKLAAKAVEYGLKGNVYSSVSRALGQAKKKAKSTDLILVTGSIFTVAEVV